MAKGPRYVFLDVIRGIAVLWMIQVHVTNVLLDPALRSGFTFDLLNLSNGFVAPTFIFCAGSGLWIALSRKGASYLNAERSLWEYLNRLGYILFWAYMLHVPVFSLDSMLRLPTQEVLPWLQIDVLQTIVYTSLVSLGIFLVVRDLKIATWIYGALAIAVMFGTVFVWQADPFSFLPDSLAIMITPAPSSPFPLLPWSCYLFAGAFVTGRYMEARDKRKFSLTLISIGTMGPILIFMVKAFDFTTPWTDVWWKTSPGMHLFRICGILFTFGALFLIDERLRLSKVGVFLQTVGTESLFLYISHLLIVYGEGGPLFKSLMGVQYTGYPGVAISWMVVTIPLLFLMYQWKHIKQHKPTLAKRMLVVQVVWMVVTLLLVPDSFSFEKLIELIQ